jgi:hypothetical protein
MVIFQTYVLITTTIYGYIKYTHIQDFRKKQINGRIMTEILKILN